MDSSTSHVLHLGSLAHCSLLSAVVISMAKSHLADVTYKTFIFNSAATLLSGHECD